MFKKIDIEKILKFAIKHWWKIILIVIAIGIAISGFDYQGKNRSFHKAPIYQKNDVK